jgi:hypothetical protein
MQTGGASAVSGEVSIDTRPVEEVHLDLLHKRNQLGRLDTINRKAINYLENAIETGAPLNEGELLRILKLPWE